MLPRIQGPIAPAVRLFRQQSSEKHMDENRLAGTAGNIGAPPRRRRVVVGPMMILLVGSLMAGASHAEQATPSPSANRQSQASTDQQRGRHSNTGSIDTHSGGAAAESPQGDTPPGMQPVPSEPKKE
jgi:hypothetical protein